MSKMKVVLVSLALAAFFHSGNAQSISPSVTIKVVSPDPKSMNIPVIKPNYLYAPLGSPVILDCTIQNMQENALTKWNFFPKGTNDVIPISIKLESFDESKWKVEAGVNKGNTFRLTVFAPSIKSEGSYECVVEYSAQATETKSSRYIEFVDKPKISASLSSTDIKAKGGENIDLKCYASGIPTPSITWRRAGRALLPNGGEFHTRPQMTIDNIQPQNQGEYICEARNKAGTDTLRINIKLDFAPRITAEENVYQKIGYKTDLICNIDASPIPTKSQVQWTKEGRPFESKGRFKVGYTYGLNSVESYLSILGVQKEDYGTYTCMATAGGTTKSKQIVLAESEIATNDKTGRKIAPGSASRLGVSTFALTFSLISILRLFFD